MKHTIFFIIILVLIGAGIFVTYEIFNQSGAQLVDSHASFTENDIQLQNDLNSITKNALTNINVKSQAPTPSYTPSPSPTPSNPVHVIQATITPSLGNINTLWSLKYVFSGGSSQEVKGATCFAFNSNNILPPYSQEVLSHTVTKPHYEIHGVKSFLLDPKIITTHTVVTLCLGSWKDIQTGQTGSVQTWLPAISI